MGPYQFKSEVRVYIYHMTIDLILPHLHNKAIALIWLEPIVHDKFCCYCPDMLVTVLVHYRIAGNFLGCKFSLNGSSAL